MEISNFNKFLKDNRVRANTPPDINQAIDTEIAAMVGFYTDKTGSEIGIRIEKLDKERDIERYLEANAATFLL